MIQQTTLVVLSFLILPVRMFLLQVIYGTSEIVLHFVQPLTAYIAILIRGCLRCVLLFTIALVFQIRNVVTLISLTWIQHFSIVIHSLEYLELLKKKFSF